MIELPSTVELLCADGCLWVTITHGLRKTCSMIASAICIVAYQKGLTVQEQRALIEAMLPSWNESAHIEVSFSVRPLERRTWGAYRLTPSD